MIAVAVAAVLAGSVIAIVSASGAGRTPADAHVRTGERAGDQSHRGVGSLALAADYLGVSRAQLRRRLRTGATLADIANTTSGKSAGGLIDAIVAAKASRLATAAGGADPSTARRSSRLARLRSRVTADVERVPSAHSHAKATGSAKAHRSAD